MKKVLFMLHGLVHSDVEAEETQAASLVFSSQIPGYDGGEVNTTETVEITFPLIVRNCMRTFSYFLGAACGSPYIVFILRFCCMASCYGKIYIYMYVGIYI